MSPPQRFAEIFPTGIAHTQGAPMIDQTILAAGRNLVEAQRQYAEAQRQAAATIAGFNPDWAAHEISPDGWHASVGVAASNCPWCNEGEGTR